MYTVVKTTIPHIFFTQELFIYLGDLTQQSVGHKKKARLRSRGHTQWEQTCFWALPSSQRSQPALSLPALET